MADDDTLSEFGAALKKAVTLSLSGRMGLLDPVVTTDAIRRYLKAAFAQREEQAQPSEWADLDDETLAAARNAARLMMPASLEWPATRLSLRSSSRRLC
jgi:hypothetical protein